MKRTKHTSPWVWITSLYSAEEIPAAVVTFVALLLFLQMGMGNGLSALSASMLMIPWTLRPLFRQFVLDAGKYRHYLCLAEALLIGVFALLAFYLSMSRPNPLVLVACLFAVSSLCAWHQLVGRIYFERMLLPRKQFLYNRMRTFVSLSTNVVTYGVLIIMAGLLEVLFRERDTIRTFATSWSMIFYLVSGVLLVFFFIHLFTLRPPHHCFLLHQDKPHGAISSDHKFAIFAFFLLLLPQSLMFNTRVFFLLASPEEGGLDCSLLYVGFAQGTVGVIAFSLGQVIGRRLLRYFRFGPMFWWMVVPLTLSPVFYMFMSQHPLVGHLEAICCMTFLAQLCFGFGLNISMVLVHHIYGEHYRNVTSQLYMPLVMTLMIVPVALSGFLSEWLGFRIYFLVDFLFCPVALAVAWFGRLKQKTVES